MANPKLLSNLITPENDSLAIKDAYKTGIYTVIGTQTAATGSWTGALHGVPALYTGLTIMYYLPWAGSGNATLNLTLDDGTTTGPINCYYSTSRLTTHYGKGCNIVMTYYKAGDISIDGAVTTVDHWIANANYDTNTTTENRISYFAGKTGVRGVWATSLFMEDGAGRFQNICMGSDATATSLGTRTVSATKLPNSNGFKVGSSIWYPNTTYAANTNISGASVVYSSISLFDSRYSFNTLLVANSLTPYSLLYLVGTINPEDNLFYLDNPWWTQTPNDPHKVYVLVGSCFDSTTSYCRITLYEQNKWYRYDGTNLVEFVYGTTTLVSKASMTPVIDTAPYLFRQSGGDNNAYVGTEETDKLVGASAVVNQLVDNSKFINPTTSDYTVVNNGDGSLAVTIINTLASAINVLLTANATSSYVKIPRSHKYILLDNNILPTGVIYRNGYNGATIGVNVIKAQPASLDYFLLSVILPIGLTAQTFTLKPNIIDLTAMFGTAIADYVYSLEQATAGSGIAYLRKYGFFTKDYYPYTANTLQSVNTSKHIMVGKNRLNVPKSAFVNSTITIGNAKFVGLDLPINERYTFSTNAPTGQVWVGRGGTTSPLSNVRVYDGNPITYLNQDTLWLGLNKNDIDTAYAYNTQVEFGSTATAFEPYVKHEYTLPNIDLRGLYKLDASNNLYADGDVLTSDGTLTRKYELLNLGDQTWAKSTTGGRDYFRTPAESSIIDTTIRTVQILSDKYISMFNQEAFANLPDKCIYNMGSGGSTPKGRIAVIDSTYSDAETFKTAMNGVYVLIEKPTPTTEQVTGFANPQIVSKYGTEEYTDERTFPLPVGHSTNYISAVYGDREKLDSLPDRTLTDGMYAIAETGGKMTLVPTSEISVGDAETVNGHTVATDVPSGAVFTDTQANWTQTTSTALDYIKNKPTLGTASAKDVSASGNASTTQVVMGNDTRLSDARPASNVTDTYSATGTAPVSGKAVAAALGTLDGSITGSPGASKTLTAFSQTDGKVTATFGDIAVTQVNGHTVETDVPSGAVFTDTWRPTTIYENSEASAGTMLNNERVDYKGGDNVELVHTQEQWIVGSTVHTKDVVTFNSPDTTYTLGTSGNNVTLTPSSGTVQSITTPYATNSKTTGGIVRAVLDDAQTTATSFIATAQGITELYDGLTIIMKNTKITSATNWVINLNGLGGKAVYNSKTNSRITTAYALNTEYLFVFDYTNDYWVMQLAYYENNTNTIGEVAGSVVVDENGAIFDNSIVLQTQLNPPRWSSITTTGGTGTSKQHTSLGFLPNGNIIYATSAASAGGTIGQNSAWWLGSNSIRYWTNCGTSTLPSTAIGKSIYIKCTMNNGLLYIADAPWWAVDLPTTNDGYYYYYVGNMYSRYQCTFAPNHPIYYHDGFGIREYVPNEALRCYEEKNGSIITIDTDRALPVSMSKFIIDIDSEDGCTEANILHTGKNLCGGEDLCDTIKAGVAASTIDETNGTISFSASTTALGPMATGIYKENTRYTFIFTIYKGSGTSSNLKINYSDGTSYAWGGFEAGAKTTLAYTTPAGKTVTGLTKYNSSGTTTLYYNESGIFEGVLTASDFSEYYGQIDTIDFNGNTVHSGILDVLEGKLIIMDSEPYVTINVGGILYKTSSPDDTFNYIIDCGTAIIEYVKNTPITDYIETRLKAVNEWTFIDETGFDVTGAAGIVPISNYTDYSELMVEVYITAISRTDCYKGSHIIPLADGGTLPGPSAVECIFGGYNYSSGYMLNYALQCSTSGTTYNISWRSGWFTMKPNPSNNNLYNIKVYAR